MKNSMNVLLMHVLIIQCVQWIQSDSDSPITPKGVQQTSATDMNYFS